MNINLLIEAARKATGPIIRDHKELEHLQISVKGTQNFALRSRLRTKEILLTNFEKYFKDYQLIDSQEAQEYDETKSYILFNPIDGLNNFSCSNTQFAISIYVFSHEENSSAAVIYFPMYDQIYSCEEDNGAFLEFLSSEHKTKLRGGKNSPIIAINKMSGRILKYCIEEKINLSNIRVYGCAAYCSAALASGKAAAYIADVRANILDKKITALVAKEVKYKIQETDKVIVYSS